MAWAPLLLTVVVHCTGSWAQFVLTQPQSVSGSLGQTVSISCNRDSGNIEDYYVHWYQQHPGKAPTTVIYNDDQRPSGVPDRFSGSIDSTSNSASLTITGLLAEDEADYYCLSSDSSANPTVIQTHGEVRQKLPRLPAQLCPSLRPAGGRSLLCVLLETWGWNPCTWILSVLPSVEMCCSPHVHGCLLLPSQSLREQLHAQLSVRWTLNIFILIVHVPGFTVHGLVSLSNPLPHSETVWDTCLILSETQCLYDFQILETCW
uniref:Ig-like domain-containing protein n=1 Tax=Oryctolagus cuniculus TaxID=9986 RepID=G1TXW2_RABIT